MLVFFKIYNFKVVLSTLLKKYFNIIIAEDFNINLKKSADNSVIIYDLYHTINEYTRTVLSRSGFVIF